jgi:lambda repressor-like predicted transcriptional regulator/transposase-like protein
MRNGTRKAVPAGEAARLYRLGLTMGEIARIYGVSAWVIGSRLDEAGVRRRAPGGRRSLPLDRAVRSYRRQPGQLGELAAGLGIDPQLIVDRAAQPAPAQRGQGTYRADVHAADVAGLYRAGWTVTQIAGKYGTAANTILNRLESAGVARRPKSLPAVFPAGEAARRVREEKATFAGLAREYGVSDGAIRYHMTARGIAAAVHAPRVLRGVPPAGIALLYQAGLTLGEVAALHGVSRWVIAARLDEAGVARRPAVKPLPVAEAAAWYERGDSLAALGTRYGMHASTVSGKLTAAGITLRPPGGRRIAIPVGEALELYAAGRTMAQLAGQYGVCETVIYNRLTEAGAPIRRKTDFKQVDAGLLAALAARIGVGALP